MKKSEATVGTRVRTNRPFVSVPKNTEGMIVEDYGTGVLVAWDLPDKPLPLGMAPHDMTFEVLPAINPYAPLRDGFDESELGHLDLV